MLPGGIIIRSRRLEMWLVRLNVNQKKTAKKARHFIEHELPMLAGMADRDVESLSAPKLSWSTSHATGGNHQESMLIDHWSAQNAMIAVHTAAYHIPNVDYQRDIFINKFFKHVSDNELVMRYAVSPSTLNRRKNKSLVEFAIRLDVQKNLDQHNCDWLSSLVVTDD